MYVARLFLRMAAVGLATATLAWPLQAADSGNGWGPLPGQPPTRAPQTSRGGLGAYSGTVTRPPSGERMPETVIINRGGTVIVNPAPRRSGDRYAPPPERYRR